MVRTTGSNWGLKEEESMELDLRLSVGGSYSRQSGAELNQAGCIRSSVASSLEERDQQKTKREIHALRRKEAKKKREEKQLKRGLSKSPNSNNNNDDGVSLIEQECKKIKKEQPNGSECNVNLNLTADHQIDGMNHNIGSYYVVLPAENRFVYPCENMNVMSCWFAGGEEKNGLKIQPVVGYGVVPVGLDHNLGNGYGSEENCSGDRGNRKSGSNGSTNCTSSTGSDNRSSYNEGDGSNSSYTRSHSNPSGSKANDTKSHLDPTAISYLSESASVDEATCNNAAANFAPTNSSNSSPDEIKGQPEIDPYLSLRNKQPPLAYMPCVSTTGNSPNGRTVNGFLYRYTKSEVSIICVCHGISFSPAEFVQHAGGTDILHPLRHITVIPSAF